MIRFGVVSFVNSRLYAFGLEALKAAGGAFETVYAPPRQLSMALAEGELDAALIPAYDFLRGTGAGYVPGHGIAGSGAVETVRLFCLDDPNAGPYSVETLLADSRSASSVALAQVLMSNRFGRDPEIETVDIDRVLSLSPTEGLLVIGDSAHRDRPGCRSLDLGAEWTAWTGLPFVFALWVVRERERIPELRALLDQALDQAESRMDDVVREAAILSGFDPDWIRHYLTRIIRNRLTESEMAGLREFARLTGMPDPPPMSDPVRAVPGVQA